MGRITINKSLLLVTLVTGFLASCVKPAQETRITLNQTEITLYVGEDYQLTADVSPASSAGSLRWESLKPDIATVSEDGRITAVSVGHTQVVAAVDGFKEGCRVKVIPLPIPVERVSLSKNKVKLVVGRTEELTCSIHPANADSTRVVWSTTDPLVAQVENGNITAVAEGTAVIKATVAGVSDMCEVEVVTTIPVETITLDTDSRNLELGESFTINASVTPDDAVDKTIIWSSSNPLVAQVSEDGEVTTVGVGEAVITALAVSGGVSAECHVSVTVSVTSISLDVTSMEIYEGNDFTLTATVLPENAVNRNVVWTSSDEKVLTVKDGLVTAVGAGQADIIVTTEEGNHTAICSVKVLPATKPVENVVLDVQPELTMKAGQIITVTATVYPEDARNVSVAWESSDTAGNIVTLLDGEVDSRVMIKALGNGEATVSVVVKDEDREFRATVKILVDSGVSWNEGFASGNIEWD